MARALWRDSDAVRWAAMRSSYGATVGALGGPRLAEHNDWYERTLPAKFLGMRGKDSGGDKKDSTPSISQPEAALTPVHLLPTEGRSWTGCLPLVRNPPRAALRAVGRWFEFVSSLFLRLQADLSLADSREE